MEPPSQQTPLPLDYETPDPTAGRPRVFWWTYALTQYFSVTPIEAYVFGIPHCEGALLGYAIPLVLTAFFLQWPYRRWIRSLPLSIQAPLAVSLAWCVIFVARPIVWLAAYGLIRFGLLR